MAPKENNEYPIFTGVFLVDPVENALDQKVSWKLSKFHATYHFNPGGPMFPQSVVQGDFTKINHLTVYEDDDVLTSHISIDTPENGMISYQHDGRTPLHITWDSGDNPPVLAGQRLRSVMDNTDSIDPQGWSPMNIVYEIGFGYDDDVSRRKYMHIMNKLQPIGMWYTKCGPQRKPE